jgi:copper transport protein
MVLLAIGALAGSASAAFAHASLIRSIPREDAVIAAPPARFELTFSELVSPLVLKAVRPDGRAVSLDRFTLEGNTVVIDAPADLSRGTHGLSWRVISADGHPVGGTVVFSIGTPSAGALPDIEDTIDGPVRIAIWTARLLLYAGLFLGVGGVVFMCWIGGGSRLAQCIAGTTMAIGLLAASVSVGLQGLDALNAPSSGLDRAIIWQTGYATTYGTTVILAALALMAGLIALALRGWPALALSALALLGVGAALAASGHASVADPQWLTRPAVFLHGVGIAFWAGALIPLGLALATPGPEASVALRRFSRAVPYALVPLVVAGLLLAVVQLRSLDALWTTAYGAIFLAKLALLTVLFALAARNRFRLTQPAALGDASAIPRLRRSIGAEVVIMLAIFGVAALWRFTPPPRALAEAAAEPAATHIHTDKAMADLTITPGRAGAVTASIIIMTGDFGPLPAKDVTLTLANPVAGIAPITRAATQPGDGTWQVGGLIIPIAGRWSVRIDILQPEAEPARLEGQIDIRR